MSKKLGEILLEDGRITEPQLQKSLKAQLIFGGHLGTSLIELGYLDEDTLGETLSHAFNVPYASFDILQNVPYPVIRAIPAKLVEKYKVVPIRLDGKVLQLAMLDPKNLMALDEISFVTGYKIDPWVSPEIRIYQVLEKYYNIPRSQRYITLARELGRLRSRSERIAETPSRSAPLAEPEAATSEHAHDISPEHHEPVPRIQHAAPLSEAVSTPVRPPQAPAIVVEPARKPAVDHWEKYGYGRSWREFADAMERKAVAPGAATLPEPIAPVARPSAPAGSPEAVLGEAVIRLAACTSPEEVADALLLYSGRFLRRSAFFILRGDHAVGWDGSGEGIASGRMKGMNVPLVRDSIFSLLVEGRSHYLGPVPPLPSILRFYQELDVTPPKTALLLPIQIKEKTASVLYGDGGNDDDLRTIDLAKFESLCKKASLALQMIILRGKILSG